MDNKTLVMGVIGSDIHVVGNKILDYALREAGYNVVNLGIFNAHEDYINAAKETDASVIIVSSLYGHGELDCQGLKEKCIEAGLGSVLLYVGGNLMVGKQDFTDVEKKFKAMGFDRIADPQAMPDVLLGWLEEDLGRP